MFLLFLLSSSFKRHFALVFAVNLLKSVMLRYQLFYGSHRKSIDPNIHNTSQKINVVEVILTGPAPSQEIPVLNSL